MPRILPALAILLTAVIPARCQDAAASLNTTPDVNAVPYISTYYIQPRVSPATVVPIDYYVTDAGHREYLRDETTETFTVDYWVNGAKTSLAGIKAGDNRLVLKSLSPGKVRFALQATDALGRKSHRLFQEFLVVPPGADAIPADKVLKPDLKKFGAFNDDTHPVETTKGLTEMLKWASDNGYRKVVLPTGRYRLDENATVQMATRLTLDMNGSTFKLNPNALGGALMFEMFNCYDSHVINGTFEGDVKEHDFKNAPNNSEWVNAVNMGQDTQYCSFENVKILDVTGYGTSTSFGGAGTRTYSAAPPKAAGTFVPGDLDAAGNAIPSEVRTTTPKPVDIGAFLEPHGFFQLGAYLGYQGNPAGNWVYKASFYDADQKYLESIEGYMYRRMYPPQKARYARFTLFSTATPANLTLFNFRTPYNCAFINVRHENVRCVGMVPSGFNNLLVEGNTFENCGWASARCAFDAEDGWDLMQDLTFRKNVFGTNPSNEFLTCAGHNFVMEDNIMKVHMWDRTRSAVFRNNTLKSASFLFGTRNRSGYHRITKNTFEGGVTLNTQTPEPTGEFAVRDSLCRAGANSQVVAKGKGSAAYFYRCQITGGGLNAKAVRCDIKGIKNLGGTYEIVDSTVEDSLLKTSGYKLTSKITGSTVKNSQVITMGGTVVLENNKLTDVDCTAIQDWSDGHEYILTGNQVQTSLDHLVSVGNSYKAVTLRGNTITSSNPVFAAVKLLNPSKDTLTSQSVALTGNTFKAPGGTVLDIPRLPAPAVTLTVNLFNNTSTGLAELSKNALAAPNVKVTREDPGLQK